MWVSIRRPNEPCARCVGGRRPKCKCSGCEAGRHYLPGKQRNFGKGSAYSITDRRAA